MANDYAELKSRVADDLLQRSDLTSQIAATILRAIEYYASSRFYFNEGSDTVNTSSGTKTVTLPSGLRVLDAVYATVGGNYYELCKREYDELWNWFGASDSSGQPKDYAWRDGAALIFPEPNATYTLTFNGIYDEAALSDDADTNAWTSGVPADLIVARTKFVLCRDVIYDDVLMRNAKLAEREALERLRAETYARVADGKVSAGW